MPTYDCFVREQHREYRHPPIPATNLPEAIRNLRRQGIEVLRVVERPRPRLSRVAERETTMFFRNLSEAFNSALPLVDAVQMVGQESRHAAIQSACREILKDIRNGERLSTAMARQGHLFSETHVRLIEAGEQSNQLAKALTELADYREEMSRIGWQFFSYLIYPLWVLSVAVSVIFFVATFILPRVVEVLMDFKVELPKATLFMLVIQRIIVPVCFVAFFGILIALIIVRLARAIRPARLAMDEWILEVALLGKIFYTSGLSRVLGMMAMLVRQQMPMPDMLEIAGRASGNAAMEARLLTAAEGARTGSGLSEALTEANAFPTVITWRIAVAERTGNVSEALASLAATSRLDAQQMVSRSMRTLEPILVILLGLIVLSVVFSVFTPLLSIISNLTES